MSGGHGHRHSAPGEHEHDFEAAPGLPEALPAGEKLLWQGSPDWRVLARRVFHLRKLTVYFAAMLSLRAAWDLSNGSSLRDAVLALGGLGALAVLALGIVALMAWLSARNTVYTITDRRVVMRIGIVLTLSFNLPFARIASAGLRRYADGSGNVPLALTGDDKIAFAHLWPHARPWRIARPEPMLVCVPDAEAVATLLSEAWSAARNLPVAGVAPASSANASPARPAAAPEPRLGTARRPGVLATLKALVRRSDSRWAVTP